MNWPSSLEYKNSKVLPEAQNSTTFRSRCRTEGKTLYLTGQLLIGIQFSLNHFHKFNFHKHWLENLTTYRCRFMNGNNHNKPNWVKLQSDILETVIAACLVSARCIFSSVILFEENPPNGMDFYIFFPILE